MSEVFLQEQRYGKDRIRLVKVIRTGKFHEIVELTVCVLLEGDFTAAYTKADNSLVVATDTIKNTVYILAKQSSNVQKIEIFATEIGQHFISTYSHVSKANVWITQHKWTRMLVNERLHDHSFIRDGDDTRNTKVIVIKKDESKNTTIKIESGLKDLLVLKTTGSAFYGFMRDEYTTLLETDDRILSTSIDATWTYNTSNVSSISQIPFDNIFNSIRQITLDTFATDNSASVQATLYLMSKIALEKFQEINSIHYELPNKHYFAYDLDRFGLKNSGKDCDVYSPISDPSGLITATVARTEPKLCESDENVDRKKAELEKQIEELREKLEQL
ncbi:11990_t:CDS:2 [Funneliformis geosporum]|uniref:Uricase n=1 Tax=Funneliformis geosporum TaxID=1117311 RepID=A0A9W4SX64_9GLOM|nr:11990_t:CDS:2 [Funneliformis geosporum]CAI2186744.1 12098_t:CDS:2 [Funneliformis geosporum]